MSTALFNDKLAAFASLVEQHQVEEYKLRFPKTVPELIAQSCTVKVHNAKKYVRVDVGTGGRFMIERDTENIFGIKAYGVIHRGRQYGTLDTIRDWQWGDYYPRLATATKPQPKIQIVSETL